MDMTDDILGHVCSFYKSVLSFTFSQVELGNGCFLQTCSKEGSVFPKTIQIESYLHGRIVRQSSQYTLANGHSHSLQVLLSLFTTNVCPSYFSQNYFQFCLFPKIRFKTVPFIKSGHIFSIPVSISNKYLLLKAYLHNEKKLVQS